MNSVLVTTIIAIAALAVGIIATLIIMRTISRSRANAILEEAKLEAEVLKKNKLLEAR